MPQTPQRALSIFGPWWRNLVSVLSVSLVAVTGMKAAVLSVALMLVFGGSAAAQRAELAKAGGSEIVVGSQSNAQATRQVREMFANLAGYIEANVAWRRSDGADGPAIGLPGRNKQRASS